MISQRLFLANTKHLYNICTTSAQRLRRWADVVQLLYKCFVFAGLSVTWDLSKPEGWLYNGNT